MENQPQIKIDIAHYPWRKGAMSDVFVFGRFMNASLLSVPGVGRSGLHTAGSFRWVELALHTPTHRSLSKKSSFTFVYLLKGHTFWEWSSGKHLDKGWRSAKHAWIPRTFQYSISVINNRGFQPKPSTTVCFWFWFWVLVSWLCGRNRFTAFPYLTLFSKTLCPLDYDVKRSSVHPS